MPSWRPSRAGELVVFGCLAQRYAAELPREIPEVDAWFGARDLSPVLRHLGVEPGPGPRATRREASERDFSPAFVLYATTLEPAAVITRRYGLDYQSFVYHLRRYHPELMRQRSLLTLPAAEPAPAQ